MFSKVNFYLFKPVIEVLHISWPRFEPCMGRLNVLKAHYRHAIYVLVLLVDDLAPSNNCHFLPVETFSPAGYNTIAPW